MSPNDTVIVGLGMTTPVGLSAAETSASVRSNVMRMTAISWQDDHFEPFVVAEVPAEGLPELAPEIGRDLSLTQREARLLRLAAMPVLQALKTLPPDAGKPGLVAALPEHDTSQPIDPAVFLDRLAIETGEAFEPKTSNAAPRGRAGGIAAIGTAAEALRSGAAKWMLAGGIDSFRDPYILGVLTAEGRVKTATNLDGFVPGESAAFLLMTTRATAASARMTALARLSRAGLGFESGHLYSSEPYRGDGLANTLSQFLPAAGVHEPIAEVYSSMNGESHWAKEWSVAFIRNREAFQPDADIHHPADCYGDPGAAAGPLMVGLAALGMLQNFRRSPALVYCSSDHGERAMLAVTAEGR
jgi:3-oxoacyl-[acyl-carrier-protein] synthase-1